MGVKRHECSLCTDARGSYRAGRDVHETNRSNLFQIVATPLKVVRSRLCTSWVHYYKNLHEITVEEGDKWTCNELHLLNFCRSWLIQRCLCENIQKRRGKFLTFSFALEIHPKTHEFWTLNSRSFYQNNVRSSSEKREVVKYESSATVCVREIIFCIHSSRNRIMPKFQTWNFREKRTRVR